MLNFTELITAMNTEFGDEFKIQYGKEYSLCKSPKGYSFIIDNTFIKCPEDCTQFLIDAMKQNSMRIWSHAFWLRIMTA